jgi:hypothetical protein
VAVPATIAVAVEPMLLLKVVFLGCHEESLKGLGSVAQHALNRGTAHGNVIPELKRRVFKQCVEWLNASRVHILHRRTDKARLMKQAHESMLHDDKTRHDKTRQDKTRQDKTRQDKTRRDEARARVNVGAANSGMAQSVHLGS